MEKNNPKRFSQLWKEKGYYILLSLCLIAVGVSGYLFLSGAAEETEELQPVLSIPVEVEKPVKEQPAPEDTDSPGEETQTPAETSTKTEEQTQYAHAVMPVSGTVLQDYAMDHLTYHETTRDWRVHAGVDLAAEPGTPVKAAKAGTVSAVFEDSSYGTTVVIDHEGGYTTHYCNLDPTAAVAVGDVVEAGTEVGTVGNTALLESGQLSHLHFAVYCDGQPTDPAGFLY